ncbi:hypothetical protein ACCD10_30335 [Pseudomonas sp. Pseusp122]|uniref:hypothetical protein n=1 Tax=unclassified Pseudomonas TaxID=196821 RepID=UPI0039A5677E
MKRHEEAGVIKDIINVSFKFHAQGTIRMARYIDGTLYYAFQVDDDSLIPIYLTRFSMVARLGRDYRPDRSYGIDGVAKIDLGGVFRRTYIAINHIDLHPDGRVTLVASNRLVRNEVALVRLKADGSLDEEFGEAGIVLHHLDIGLDHDDFVAPLNIEDSQSEAYGVGGSGKSCSLASGALVYGGAHTADRAYIAKFTADGNLDDSFGKQGVALFIPPVGHALEVESVQALADGKIVICGSLFDNARSIRLAWIARYTEAGVIDHTYGEDGSVLIDPREYTSSNSLRCVGMVEGPDSSVVCVNRVIESSGAVFSMITCLDEYGRHIRTFNNGKPVLFQVVGHQRDDFSTLTVQGIRRTDFKIIAVGGMQLSTGEYGFLVARFNSDGSRDTSFAGTGWIHSPLGPRPNILTAVSADERLIVAMGAHVLEYRHSAMIVTNY